MSVKFCMREVRQVDPLPEISLESGVTVTTALPVKGRHHSLDSQGTRKDSFRPLVGLSTNFPGGIPGVQAEGVYSDDKPADGIGLIRPYLNM